MWKSQIKLALRSLWKNKLNTTVKLAGFIIGITSCLLVVIYLQHELSYDAFHEKAERIVRVVMEYGMGGESGMVNVTGNKVGPAFQEDFAEVENSCRVIEYNQVVKFRDQVYEEPHFYYADSTFFDLFTFPLLRGNPREALRAPNQLVITERMAKKYFGEEYPMGKVLRVGTEQDYTVAGVMRDPPPASQLKPDFIGSFVSLRDARPERLTWWNANYATYLLLHSAGGRAGLQARIPDYMRRHASETGAEGENFLSYRLEPLREVHLRSPVPGNFEPNGDIRYIYILSAIGLLILLISTSSYINLATAVSTERAKEIGVQKVLGAGRWQLFWQHLLESLVLTGLALAVSVALTPLLLPYFSNLFGRPLDFAVFTEPAFLGGLALFGLLASLLAGAYPAAVISGLEPYRVLKGAYKHTSSGAWLRQSLIVFQFAVSVILIISTLVLQGQMRYVQEKKLGYDKTHVLALQTDRQVIEKLGALRSELVGQKGIQSLSLVYETPVHIKGGYDISKSVNGEQSKMVTALPADEYFLETAGIGLAAGKGISAADMALAAQLDSGSDTSSALPILINEAQARAFNWAPEEAVRQFVNFNGKRVQIKGVVKDFHFASLHEPIGNLVLFPTSWGNSILVKLDGRDLPGALHFMEKKWERLAPHRPFAYHFLDEEFGRMYANEWQTARLVTTFSWLAILLACLALFGVSSYSIIQRSREVSIRKVLGASMTSLIGLLSGNFLKLVLWSLLAALPLGWYLMHQWLQNFTYHIEIKWWMFVLAAMLALGAAFLSVSVQSIRTAMVNPAEELKGE
ncbi:MAG: ABC transporter permease [Lewinellaceae bacterium]|nr:ABC transporter permease [Phaeodactylibacter sp.]MCB9036680.1 ABC transporter permease [Lewinellaceae bacterium]